MKIFFAGSIITIAIQALLAFLWWNGVGGCKKENQPTTRLWQTKTIVDASCRCTISSGLQCTSWMAEKIQKPNSPKLTILQKKEAKRVAPEFTPEESEERLKLLHSIRGVPYFQGGKAVGVRVFGMKEESKWESWGLKDGDIIIEQNGATPDRMVDIIDNYLSSKKTTNFTVMRGQKNIGLKIKEK